jgi:hypothetical protein
METGSKLSFSYRPRRASVEMFSRAARATSKHGELRRAGLALGFCHESSLNGIDDSFPLRGQFCDTQPLPRPR